MDKDILEALYHRYYHAAVLYCTALCGDAQLAQDITADAFVKAYLSLPNEVPSFRYWLLRVCRNLWIDHLRRQRRLVSEDALENLTDGITPETRYLQNERNRCLWKLIATLSPLDKELVTLHYFSGLPLQEISLLMGKSYPSVRQHMTRLRHTLKLRMEEHGYGQEL